MSSRCPRGSRRRPPKTGSCVRHEDVKRRKSSKKCKYARNSKGYCMTKREYDAISKRKGNGAIPSLPNDIWKHIMDIRVADERAADLQTLEKLVKDKARITSTIARKLGKPPTLDLMRVMKAGPTGGASTEEKSRLLKELAELYPAEAKFAGKRVAEEYGLRFVDNF